MLSRQRSLILTMVTASITVGCARLSEKEMGWMTCTNTEAGYAVTYPADWKTNQGDVLPLCSLFDPLDVAVSPGTEIPFDIALTILKQDVPFDKAIQGYGAVKVLVREELRIDGHRAVRMEFVDEEPQIGPSAQLSYQYLIDLGGKTLEVSTHAVGKPAYPHKKSVLDRVMRNLRIDESDLPGSQQLSE